VCVVEGSVQSTADSRADRGAATRVCGMQASHEQVDRRWFVVGCGVSGV
jgi:hypothetical protein